MVWTTADDVRLLTGLTTTQIDDADLNSLIEVAQKEVLLNINQNVTREPVEFIDDTRKNEINNSNTIFYIKNWEGNFISDYDFDLTVDTSDVVVVSVDSDGIETSETVDSIVYSAGKFVLSTAPDEVDLLVSHAYSAFDPVTPDPLLKLATEFLAASYAYMRIGFNEDKKVKFGNTEIKTGTDSKGNYLTFYNKYLDLMRQLNESDTGGAIWGESVVQI